MPVDVLDQGLVGAKVERDAEGARAVGRWQRCGFPAAGGETERGVLQLRLGWSEDHRKLAEDLCVCVQRVARRGPGVVGQRRPR